MAGGYLSAGLPQHDGVFPGRRPALTTSFSTTTGQPRAGRALAGVSSSSPTPRSDSILPASSGSNGPSPPSCERTEFDFARAEDKERRLRRHDPPALRGLPGEGRADARASDVVLGAVDEYFADHLGPRSAAVEKRPGRVGARATSGPCRSSPSGPIAGPISGEERDGDRRVLPGSLREKDGLRPRGRRSRLRSPASSCPPTSATGWTSAEDPGPASGRCRATAWPTA